MSQNDEKGVEKPVETASESAFLTALSCFTKANRSTYKALVRTLKLTPHGEYVAVVNGEQSFIVDQYTCIDPESKVSIVDEEFLRKVDSALRGDQDYQIRRWSGNWTHALIDRNTFTDFLWCVNRGSPIDYGNPREISKKVMDELYSFYKVAGHAQMGPAQYITPLFMRQIFPYTFIEELEFDTVWASTFNRRFDFARSDRKMTHFVNEYFGSDNNWVTVQNVHILLDRSQIFRHYKRLANFFADSSSSTCAYQRIALHATDEAVMYYLSLAARNEKLHLSHTLERRGYQDEWL